MSWSGGSYTKGNAATGGWAGDASLGIGIEAGRHDTQDNDFATGINNCLAKDGQNAMTANINLGGYVPTNVGAGTAAAPAYCAGNDSNTGMFSPTADNIGFATNGSERVRIDNTGKVGIGTTSPSSVLDIRTNQVAISQNGPLIQMYSNDTIPAEVNFTKSRAATLNTNTIVQSGDFLGVVRFFGANGTNYTQGAAITGEVDGTPGASNDMPGRLCFYTTADGSGTATERMRIDNNGNVGIGVAAGAGRKLDVNGPAVLRGNVNSNSFTSSSVALNISYVGLGTEFGIGIRPINDNSTAIEFRNAANTFIGNIAQGASSVSYNTTSDYRLKTNIAPMTGALSRVSLLKPCTFDWVNTNEPSEGFIAHELAAEVPNAVTGEKDAVDADGNPRYQGVDYGKLTTILTAAIQELNAKVEALEARIAVLEA